jgi:hypothetical protein
MFDRIAQVEPKFLLAVSGYRCGGKTSTAALPSANRATAAERSARHQFSASSAPARRLTRCPGRTSALEQLVSL